MTPTAGVDEVQEQNPAAIAEAWGDVLIHLASTLPVGGKIWFADEKRPYVVRARSDRYLVCTKPYNLKRTTLYTIVDLRERVRGPENLVFGMGAETREHCEAMIARLHDPTEPSDVSWRNRVELRVTRVERAS